jgi:hypothetical protein
MRMDFDCWTGLKIKGTSYIIAEKICYKEKTSDDAWTEYGLITSKSNDRIWLTIADGGLSCSLSHPVARVSPPQGYRLHDRGMELVTGVWGDTDAAVGDTAEYEQYESADGAEMFFLENWEGTKSGSRGTKIAASDIVPNDAPSAERDRLMAAACRKSLNRFSKNSVIMGATVAYAVIIAAFLFGGVTDLGKGDWHDFRRFVNMPYALHERLADAPYYAEEAEEGGARIYTAHIDAASAALDLIEGVDGRVQDAYEDLHDAEHPIIIRTQTELARITAAADGTARIVLIEAPTDAAPAADQLQRGHILARYGVLVCTGDQRGRAGVTAEQEGSGAVTPSAAPAGTAPNAAPAPAAPASEDTQRRTRHLAH